MESLAGIKKIVRELDPKLPATDDAYKVATILLSSALNKQKTSADIVRFTGLPAEFVTATMLNLRKNGLGWKRGKFVHGGWLENGGGMAFWLDVGVGLGWFEKSATKGR